MPTKKNRAGKTPRARPGWARKSKWADPVRRARMVVLGAIDGAFAQQAWHQKVVDAGGRCAGLEDATSQDLGAVVSLSRWYLSSPIRFHVVDILTSPQIENELPGLSGDVDAAGVALDEAIETWRARGSRRTDKKRPKKWEAAAALMDALDLPITPQALEQDWLEWSGRKRVARRGA